MPENVQSADRDWEHLYPSFRTRLHRVLERLRHETGTTWSLIEGYRSPRRQLWLYGQGRTRSGPIVTYKRHPTWHGAGLAGDVAPLKEQQPDYTAPMPVWEKLRAAGAGEGLENPAWAKGDRGHLQLSSLSLRSHALAWCRAGFLVDRPSSVPGIAIFVDGQAVLDAEAQEEEGQVWVWARAVLDAGECVISMATAELLTVLASEGKASPAQLPCRRIGPKGFVTIASLEEKLGWRSAVSAHQTTIQLATSI